MLTWQISDWTMLTWQISDWTMLAWQISDWTIKFWSFAPRKSGKNDNCNYDFSLVRERDATKRARRNLVVRATNWMCKSHLWHKGLKSCTLLTEESNARLGLNQRNTKSEWLTNLTATVKFTNVTSVSNICILRKEFLSMSWNHTPVM